VWKLTPEAEAFREQRRERANAMGKAKGLEPISEYELDLRCLKFLPFRNRFKFQFLLRCFDHQWADTFHMEAEGVQNYWAVRMAKALTTQDRVNLMGCGSSGKTAIASAYLYTIWKANAYSSSVFLSTTSGEAAQARTWGQIKDWHTRDRYPIGKRIESMHLITLDEETRNEEGEKERDYRNSIKVVLIKKGSEGENVVASIVGRKNDFVYWCCDEFPFMDLGVLDARVNLNTNPFNQFIGLGNAPKEGDPMYLDSEPFGADFPDGWRSVDKDVQNNWPTKKGWCFYFNGADSPNFKTKSGNGFPKLMNEEMRQKVLKDSGGEDTTMYWRQFYGFPPGIEIPDKIITYTLLEAHDCFKEALWSGLGQKSIAGLDLGFREDGDPCVLDFAHHGQDTRGKKIAAFERDGIVLNPSQKSGREFERQIAKRVIEECRPRNCHDLALDVSGDGGMILQAIEREAREQKYQLNVTPISFSGTADDAITVPGEKRTTKEMYDRKVTQLWASFRISVTNGVIRGCDPLSKAINQLCSRKYNTDDKKRFTVEPKKEMKKRLKRSPDHADARVLCHFLALKMGLSGVPQTTEEVQAQKREDAMPRARPYSGHGTSVAYARR